MHLRSLPLTIGLSVLVANSAALARTASPLAEQARARQILYVLVNTGSQGSYVALYHAYGTNPNPAPFRIVKNCVDNPGAIWVDGSGNLYVANDLTYDSSVCVYAPASHKVLRKYTSGIGLPFGGTVDASGTMYVSDGGLRGQTEGAVAVFPAGTSQPSQFLTDKVFVPHGVAVDGSGNLFLAQIYGDSSSVLEFPAGSTASTVLPLNLPQNAFLEDLKLDSHNDIVVADAYLNVVRFFAPPYNQQSGALTSGLSAPTALAYGPDGSLFVGNEYVNVRNGNVVVFAPGAKTPTRTILTGINGGVLGVAVGPGA